MEHFLAGFLSGTITAVLCSPLDVIKTRYQVRSSTRIPIKEYYRGLSANMLATPLFWSSYFYVLKSTDTKYTYASPIIASSIGSLVSSPFWVARTAMQAGEKGSCFEILRKRYSKYGTSSLFKGYLMTVAYNFQLVIMMPIYEKVKNYYNGTNQGIIIASVVSKSVSGIVVYPIDTLRSISRVYGKYPKNLFEYYRGFSIYLLRSIPFAVSVFLNYELASKFLK